MGMQAHHRKAKRGHASLCRKRAAHGGMRGHECACTAVRQGSASATWRVDAQVVPFGKLLQRLAILELLVDVHIGAASGQGRALGGASGT